MSHCLCAHRAELQSRGQFERNMAEVALEAETKQDSADALECNDPNVATEYRTRQRQIDLYAKQFEVCSTALTLAESSLETKKVRALPEQITWLVMWTADMGLNCIAQVWMRKGHMLQYTM